MPVLTLPFPPNELRVNRTMGQPWYITHKAKLEYQDDCRMQAGLVQRRNWEGIAVAWPTVLRVYFYLGKGQRADAADVGGWIKAALDCLTELGVWPDDGSKYLSKTETTVLRDRERPRVDLYWGDDEKTLALEALAVPQRVVRVSRRKAGA